MKFESFSFFLLYLYLTLSRMNFCWLVWYVMSVARSEWLKMVDPIQKQVGPSSQNCLL